MVGVAAGLADGAALREGDLLVQLDPAPTELELDAERTALRLARVHLETARQTLASALRAATLAEEQLVLLRADEERWRGLVETGRAERTRLDLSTRARLAGQVALEDAQLSSRSASGAVDAGEQEVALAGQRLALLEDRLDRLAMRAPFDGTFTSSRVEAPGSQRSARSCPRAFPWGRSWISRSSSSSATSMDDAASIHSRVRSRRPRAAPDSCSRGR